jgi:NAD(P) transhydrogenase subunit alpha
MTDTPDNGALHSLAEQARALADHLTNMSAQAPVAVAGAGGDAHAAFLVTGLTVFVLACFVGYYVVWRVTPALHSPLMAVTNAISSVVIVGALIAVGLSDGGFSQVAGFIAVVLASINIFGGFIVSRRMLAMFKKKG